MNTSGLVQSKWSPKVHGIMNTSGLVQSKWSPKGFTYFAWDPKYSWFHEPSKIEFITYINILYYQSSINFHLT